MSDMSAVILASGNATRLGELTHGVPKCMLSFNGQPFLRYLVKWLLRQGVSEVVITANSSCKGTMIQKEVKENFPNNEIVVVMEESATGTASSALKGLQHVSSECKDAFVLTGDSIWDLNIWDLYDFHIKNKAFCTGLVTTSPRMNKYGEVKFDKDGEVVQFWGVPKEYDKEKVILNGCTKGFFVCNIRCFIKALRTSEAEFFDRDPMAELMPRLYAYQNENFFLDYGTPEAFHELASKPQLIERYFGKA